MGETTSQSEAPPGAGGSGMPNTLRPTWANTEEEVFHKSKKFYFSQLVLKFLVAN